MKISYNNLALAYERFCDIKNPFFYKIRVFLDETPVEFMFIVPVLFFFIYNYSRKSAFYYALIITSAFAIISFNAYDWFTAVVVGAFPILCFVEFFFAWLEYSSAAEKKIVKLLSKEDLSNRDLDLLYQFNLQRKPIYLDKIRKIVNFGRELDYIAKIDEKLLNERLETLIRSINGENKE